MRFPAATTLAVAVATAPPAPAPNPPAAEPAHRRAARYAWALLLAGIYGVFPLRCPKRGGAMRIIAFIIDAHTVRVVLAHLDEQRTLPSGDRARPSALKPSV